MTWKPTKDNLKAMETSIIDYCTSMRTNKKEPLQIIDAKYFEKFERDSKKPAPSRRAQYDPERVPTTLKIKRPYADDEDSPVESNADEDEDTEEEVDIAKAGLDRQAATPANAKRKGKEQGGGAPKKPRKSQSETESESV
jgi:hypothetical protein